MNTPQTIIFFDGICNLCNGWVDFISTRSAFQGSEIKFASLQGKTASDIFSLHGRKNELKSIVLYQNGEFEEESTAVLKILILLGLPWSFLSVLLIVPGFLRNAVYRMIAKNRYRWFGKKDTCRLPTSENRGWFLD